MKLHFRGNWSDATCAFRTAIRYQCGCWHFIQLVTRSSKGWQTTKTRGFADRKTRYRACMNIQMEQSLKARWPSWFQRIDGLLQRLKKICHGPFAIKMAERAKTHQWKQTTCYIKRHVNFRPSHLTKTSSLTVETSWSAQLIAWM